MKRSSFLKFGFAIGSFLAAPFNSIAKTISYGRDDKGFKVDAGKDRFEKPITLLEGDTFYTKVSTKDTEGDLYINETTRVKEGGPALHYHTEIDEWFYVLQGEFLIKVGEETYDARAGDSVFGPRMVPHTFAKVGKEEGKLLTLFQPAGKMEAFFKAISEGKPSKMTKEEQDAFRREHGIIWVGSPLKNLKGWQTENKQ
jgi:mannose-6-phosphate isomerase-like protein (cupin superfamily)